MVLLNAATYLRDGNRVEVNGSDLLSAARPISVAGMDLECYPNRNSLSYQTIYNIPEAQTLLRGTLRYEGFCAILELAQTLGLMHVKPGILPAQMSWKDYLEWPHSDRDFENQQANSPNAWQALDWLGVLSDQPIKPNAIPIDVFCALLLQKLSYLEGEQDMIILQHKFVIKKPDNSRYFISSVLKQTGEAGGHSAMARTVGFPAAIAAQMIADGVINETGVIRPVSKNFYPALLAAITAEGIRFEETVSDETEISVNEFLAETR